MALEDLRKVRIEKLAKLRDAGVDPYPARLERTHTIARVVDDFDALATDAKSLMLVGRVLAMRGHGGITFMDIDDGSGTIQALVKEDTLGEAAYRFFTETVDIGDFVQINGVPFRTKRNERTIEVATYRILTKSIRPLPEKWHGLQDTEERLRHRYLDLVMRPEERKLFVQKARFWAATREFLLAEGGLEVETPVLERIPGGADAEPFKTHLNALDVDMYLRIAPELNLKRLLVGGFEKVFEIGRIFRNEGMDREHLQDYTQMEMYWAYTDYERLMSLVERLVRGVVLATLGTTTHRCRGQAIDWAAPWKRIDYFTAFGEKTGIDLGEADENNLAAYAREVGIDTSRHSGKGRLVDVIFKKKVRPTLIEPGFLVLPPVDIEPLAKKYPADPRKVERFQLVAGGSELGKGFSELNDPLDQHERFVQQERLGKAGDKEAQRMDEEYVMALEYGMPPAAGFAYSERLFAFLVDRPVRETVFFPLVRPKK